LNTLSEFFPWASELFRDLALLLAPAPRAGHIWLFGERRADIARALCARSHVSGPPPNIVLAGDNPEELFAEKTALNTECMGFLCDIQRPGWSGGLPRPVLAISASFCLSRLCARETQMFLREACHSLCPGGVLLWSDFFLPQSLDLLTIYQKEHADRIEKSEAFEALLLKRDFILFEKAMQVLTENGFSNFEVAAKRMNLAVIAAYK
jgi:hypothetical protein